MLKNISFLLLFVFVTQACYKDNNESTQKVITEFPDTIIETTNVAGSIAYSDKSVPLIIGLRFNDQSSATVKPYFYFKAENINQHFEILSIDLASGHTLSYPINNVANTDNKHSIVIPKLETTIEEQNGTFDFELSSGKTFNFPAHSFTKNNSTTSSPTIYFTELTSETIPGNGQGISAYKEPTLLNNSQTFYLGWTDNEITLNLEDQLETTVTEELYYLDPFTGQWTYHELNGEFHPGFYSFSDVLLAEAIEMTVNHDIPTQDITISTVASGTTIAMQSLSLDNRLATFVPLEQDFDLIMDLHDEELKSTSHFLTSKENIEVTIEDQNFETIDIFLSIRDCAVEYDTNNILEITGDNYHSYILINSESFKIIRPSAGLLKFRVLSGKNEMSTTEISYENTNEIYLGKQFLCSEVDDEFLYFLTEGHARVLTTITTTYDEPNMSILATNPSTSTTIEITFIADEEGKIDDENINVIFYAPNLASGYRVNCGQSTEGCGFSDFDIKLFRSPENPYVKAVFQGEFWMESFEDNDVGYRKMEGEFQVKVL